MSTKPILTNSDDVGAQADTSATTDTGTFSLIALFKRLLEKFTDFLSRIPAALTASGNFKVSIEENAFTAVDVETILASASVSANRTSADITNSNYRRMIMYLNISVEPGDFNFSMSPTVQVKDPVSGNYQTIWTSDTVINSGGTGLRSYYFGDNASGGSFNEVMPFGIPGGTFRFVIQWNGGAATTYSVAIAMMQ